MTTDSPLDVLIVFGTRPEAIKLAPVIRAASTAVGVRVWTCATAQHRELLDSVLATFGITPDFDLDVMVPDQELDALTARILGRVREVLTVHRPDLVIVQGDTTSAMATALAAHHAGIEVAHIEAGLRTSSIAQPWPEEANRRIITRLATLHFAPTQRARQSLTAEGVDPATIHVVGNTGIDAARLTTPADHVVGPGSVLVTCHRRENQRDDFAQATRMIAELARSSSREFVMPLHPSPRVREPMRKALGSLDNLQMIEPLDYPAMLGAVRDAYVIVTDSGGVQEEAAWFGTPCLVARDVTDRPESVEAGHAFVVGVDPAKAIAALNSLEDREVYERTAQPSTVFGDGGASARIVRVLTDRSTDRRSVRRDTASSH